VLSTSINDKYSFKYLTNLKKCNGKEVNTCCMTTVLYTSLISGYGEHWSFMKGSIHTHTQRNVLAARTETRKLGYQNCMYFFPSFLHYINCKNDFWKKKALYIHVCVCGVKERETERENMHLHMHVYVESNQNFYFLLQQKYLLCLLYKF
jgi:hypothetical protein